MENVNKFEMAKVLPSALLVEDELLVRQFLSEVLRRFGFDVSVCIDAESGCRKVEGWRPDVVLTDCNLPGASGIEFARAVRARWDDAVIIGMSAEHFRGRAMLDGGASAFIEKPIELVELRSLLSGLVRGLS